LWVFTKGLVDDEICKDVCWRASKDENFVGFLERYMGNEISVDI